MKTNIISYLICAGVFLGADAVWLSVAGNPIYRSILGDILLDKFSVGPALVFYAFY